jgi:hypothetical protein
MIQNSKVEKTMYVMVWAALTQEARTAELWKPLCEAHNRYLLGLLISAGWAPGALIALVIATLAAWLLSLNNMYD